MIQFRQMMANDFVFNYETEEREEEQSPRKGQNHGHMGGSQNDKGMGRICKAVDCLNTLQSFVASRNNERLSELFSQFEEEFSATLERQLLRRLTQKISEPEE